MVLKVVAAALAALLFAGNALAQLLTEKKVFTLPEYATVGGRTIRDVRVGYESYGKLNAAGDNAIFVAHFFSGNSHAAGRYKPEDKAPGYWDSVIGPGKPFDTDKYFVLSADTLVNLNVKDPGTTTTGPASLNPASGKPYGMSFPIVTMRDFVRVQKALADALGIKRFAAVTGASMGSLQTMEWAAAYPEMVERAIPVLPGGLEANPYLIEMLNTWAAPIVADPKWNGGDYYGREEPTQGLADALKLVTLNARHYGWADKTFGRKWAAADKSPLQDWGNRYAIEDTIDKVSAARAAGSDANSFLYLVRANQLYQIDDAKRIKARVLSIVAKSDLLLYPDFARKMAATLRSQGNHVEEFEIDADGGHLDGVLLIAKAGDAIRAFLQK
ncbi:MAG TPA: homoserine O-acetyltransferase [Burkholderiales bacterium]|nr:homoserine O-acetyltransferase [Burkholderiales bacterium]